MVITLILALKVALAVLTIVGGFLIKSYFRSSDNEGNKS